MVYAISNIHGNYTKFKEMLDKISFSENDIMYVLGDIVDYGDETMEVVCDLSVRMNVYPVKGEHDAMAYKMLSGFDEMLKKGGTPNADFIAEMQTWSQNGGDKTLAAFRSLDADMKEGVLDYLADMAPYEVAGIGEMVSPGEKCLIDFPFTGSFGLGDLIAKAVEQLGGIPVKAGFGGCFRELCELVEREQPQTYIGFPVCFLSLLRMYGEGFPVRRALLSADACPEGVMAALKEEGIGLYPHYGSREMCLGGAITCSALEGMHLRENHVIAEIIDEAGDPLPDGQWGELVITTIDMEAMPLIRYRTGDRAREDI